jgi:hypothetical protein
MISREGTVNAVEQLKALDAQREKVLEEARAVALQRAQDAIRELNELGLRYHLVQESSGAIRSRQAPGPAESKPAANFDQTLCGS